MTSHAALVARQMGRVCVAGCGELAIDYGKHTMTVKGRTLKEGDWISIDGTTGQVIEGKINTKPSEVLQVLIEKTLEPKDAPVYQTFAKVMAWADKYRTLKIRTNADQPDQSRPTPWPSAPRASASAGPSTCSSARARSARCGR